MSLNRDCGPLGRHRERAWLLLGPFSCLRLYLQGSSDAARGLRLERDWTLSSPFVVCEQRRERQSAAKCQLRLEELTAERSIELEILQDKAKALELDIADAQAGIERLEQRRGMSGQDESMLSWRGVGEQRLAEDVVRQRRRQELERLIEHQLRPLIDRVQAADGQLPALRSRGIELQAAITQARQRTEKSMERRTRRTELRLAVYCQAVFKAGVKIDRRERDRRERERRRQEKRERLACEQEGRSQWDCQQERNGLELEKLGQKEVGYVPEPTV